MAPLFVLMLSAAESGRAGHLLREERRAAADDDIKSNSLIESALLSLLVNSSSTMAGGGLVATQFGSTDDPELEMTTVNWQLSSTSSSNIYP